MISPRESGLSLPQCQMADMGMGVELLEGWMELLKRWSLVGTETTLLKYTTLPKELGGIHTVS